MRILSKLALFLLGERRSCFEVVNVEPLCLGGSYVDHFVDLDCPVEPEMHLLVTIRLGAGDLRSTIFWHLVAVFAKGGEVQFAHWNGELNKKLLFLMASGLELRPNWLLFHAVDGDVRNTLGLKKRWLVTLSENEREKQMSQPPDRGLDLETLHEGLRRFQILKGDL